MTHRRVVIVGAGFGGLACARALAGTSLDVTLIDRHNYLLFTPLLYQVASSLLNPSDIAYPVRAVFRRARNVRVMLAEARGVDLERRTVSIGGRQTESDPEGRLGAVREGKDDALPYDYLVLAAGSTTNFFGNQSVEAHAHGLKDLPEALELRNHVLRCFEAAARESDDEARRPWLTFVIVGAGPTGVEYAGALSELVRLVLVKDFHELNLGKVRILLIEGRDQVLPAFPRRLGASAERVLRGRGIEVRLGVLVESAARDVVTLRGGERIPARTLIWAAGVKSGLVGAAGLPLSKSGRIVVDEYLRVSGQERVFAIGDVAAVPWRGGEMPMLSAPAIQEGRSVASNIVRLEQRRSLSPFRYLDKGIMATIGRKAAVAQLGPLALTGFIGWLAWLLVHLYFIIGFRNRLVVLIEWAWDYFRYDRPIRLIERAKEAKT
jgi:NADH dehydrogenase